jgi:hypothetical protein
MMKQPNLFEPDQQTAYGPVPTCHTNDPETSRIADAQHEASGKKQRNADLVLSLVKRFPGKTANELFEAANDLEQMRLCDFYEIRRRLTDLHHAGKVKVVEQRNCKIKGSLMQTWEVIL